MITSQAQKKKTEAWEELKERSGEDQDRLQFQLRQVQFIIASLIGISPKQAAGMLAEYLGPNWLHSSRLSVSE